MSRHRRAGRKQILDCATEMSRELSAVLNGDVEELAAGYVREVRLREAGGLGDGFLGLSGKLNGKGDTVTGRANWCSPKLPKESRLKRHISSALKLAPTLYNCQALFCVLS